MQEESHLPACMRACVCVRLCVCARARTGYRHAFPVTQKNPQSASLETCCSASSGISSLGDTRKFISRRDLTSFI